MKPRWDGDDRGSGIAAAEQLVPGAGELLAAFGHPTWVAEQPERHPFPHVDAWCRKDERLALTRAHPDGSGAFVLDLEWVGDAPGGVGEVRAAGILSVG